ncbi:hypothetical protein G3A49_13295 [Haloferax volcanii]|uniref:Uncharacterized protein n=1 Tax=Haloferax volcanii TaxID=2246 RepID=A0A6C0UU49_HALVO|nr:hypothetical protein [Haloferax alexandrinus]QIB79056.1 hypothetical protein G3A49_13295 [Haloferax alexandrinus]
MPWIGLQNGEKVIPEGIENGTSVNCPDCGGKMYPRGPSSDGRARHFYHPNGSSGCGGVGVSGGESDLHLKMKSLAVSRLRELFSDELAECVPEKKMAAPVSNKDHRRADAFLRFEERDEQLGIGAVIEVQYRNEAKNLKETVSDYISQGYSIVWASEEDFADDRCLLDEEDIRQRARDEVWPNRVPDEYSWNTPVLDTRVLNNWSRETKVVKNNDHSTESEMAWLNNLLRLDEIQYGLDYGELVEQNPDREVHLPVEYLERLARQCYRDTAWDDLFEPYVWDTKEVKKEWGELSVIDSLEVKFPLSKWMGDNGCALVVGERISSSESAIIPPHDLPLRNATKVAELGDSKTAVVVPVSEARRIGSKVDRQVLFADDEERIVFSDLEIFISSLTNWRCVAWEDLFSGTLELPIQADVDIESTIVKGEIPVGKWIASGDIDSVRDSLYRAFEKGRQYFSDSDNEEAVERVQRIVKYNTGDSQSDTIAEHTIVMIACQANCTPNAVRWAIRHLVSDGTLEETEGGRYRLHD